MKTIGIIGNVNGDALEMAIALKRLSKHKGFEIILANNVNSNPFIEDPVIINDPYLRYYETSLDIDFKVYDKPKSKFHK